MEIVGIRGIYLHIPVIDRTDLVDLFFDIGNVLRCGNGRVLSCLDRVVFCRKSESIPSHGMDQIIALHHFIAAPYI